MAQKTGYLMVDHRASPGLPEDVARAAGMDPQQCKEGKLFEADTLTCAHCKGTVIKNPFRTRAREDCPKCSHKYLCDYCYAETQMPDYNHLSYEAKVDIVTSGGTLLTPPPVPLLRSNRAIERT